MRNPDDKCKSPLLSRREFLEGSAASAAALTLLSKPALADSSGPTPPSDRITLACIGVGAQGTRVMMDFLKIPDVQVAAVCDVNLESADYSEWGPGELVGKERRLVKDPNWGSDWKGPTCGRAPAARLVDAYYRNVRKLPGYRACASYNDFRELIAKERDLDGVVVCTPDHWHAFIAIYAMRHGKHVFSQKPMTHSVHECALMAQAARETGRATQVAVMDEASDATRQLTEWVAAGVIGQVREVHNWSQRPLWPQGIETPKEAEPVPEGLDWDLWLGPAPERPFNHVYLPFVWRGWHDYGEGSIGDMGNYSFDTLFRVLKLTAPTSVEGSSTPLFPESFPLGELVHWEFPARPGRAPVAIHWYDAHLRPLRPPELEPGELMSDPGNGEGMLFVGDKGKILCGFMGGHPRLIPSSRMKTFTPPPDNLPKSPGTYREWLNAIRGGAPPRANYEFEQNVVEALLLGCIAVRTGTKLEWDAESKRITSLAEGKPSDLEAANALLNPPARAPWKLS
ncbi:MAG: Gfo/Idh/MocA family oxidoreductase [Acidobacteriota bacterium]